MSKTIVVTGGTKGIGRAIVQRFYENGYKVITCSRKESNLSELKKDFPKVIVKVSDLSRKDEVMAFSEFVLENTDQIDVLVNNTGVFFPGQVHREDDGVLEAQIETNLYSAYHLTRAILPSMIQKKEGDVFNMCSIASVIAYPNGGSYSISKFALYGMTKVLREEMKPHGIRVSAVLPGATFTASWEGVDVDEDRLMPAEDVAEAVWSAHTMSRRTVMEEIVVRPQLGDL